MAHASGGTTKMSYYKRKNRWIRNLEGQLTKSFKNKSDERAEEYVLALLREKYPEYDITAPTDPFSPIDFIVVNQNGRHIADIELKHRSNSSWRYKTVWLNRRKAHALQEALDAGRQAIFIVMWTDIIGWIKAEKALTAPEAIRGTKKMVKSRTDARDHVRLVPISWFAKLGDTPKL